MTEPGPEERLNIALDHFRDSIAFYGDKHGVKIFRKHLAAYIENAPWPADAPARRDAKSRLCRMRNPREIEDALAALWYEGNRTS
jgi:tRNA-dihydrouridine synthase